MASFSIARSSLLLRVSKQHLPPSRHIRRYHDRTNSSIVAAALLHVKQARLFSSAETQPENGDDSAASVANPMDQNALPATAFVGREDQKVEEQKRRRLSDVS
jgi:hypothetical protein